jgi:uncharacterized protein (DUF1015 family)
MQKELYKKNPYNFVRLILGKENPKDDEKNNRYIRAKKQFEEWLEDLILIETDKKAIFPYKIEYKINNKFKIMSGFFALLKLDPEYKQVKAHESTLSKPKADRLNLIKSCNANLEPIQLLYIDDKDEIRKRIDKKLNEPIFVIKGYDGFTHKLWKIEDENINSMVFEFLKNKILFIADGHHRYQTAINYANEMKKKTGNIDKNASFNYRMVILANIFDDGLSILPTHRLIKKSNINIENLVKNFEKYFYIDEVKVKNNNYYEIVKRIKDCLKTDTGHKFVMYVKGKYYILKLKDEKYMYDLASEHSKTWQTLDVSILHKIILENLLDINQDNLEDHVKYTRVDEEAIRFVEEGKYDLSFLMNATKIEELKAVADAGEHMPQKSTYFLPKMLSGLVVYRMDI